MRAVVDGAEDEMRMPQPLDAAGFAHACHAGLGRFFTLLSTIDAAQAREHDAAAALGAYCDAVERIRCAAVAPHRVEQVLQPAALGELTATDRVARIERALQRFSAATVVADGLPPFVRNWYALSRAMHEKMRRKRYPVARPPLDRAPLAKLWTAWRCR